MLAVLFGVLCIVCYVLLTKLTIERVRQSENSQKEKFNYKNVLKAVVKNRPLIGVMVATVEVCSLSQVPDKSAATCSRNTITILP